MKKILAAVGFCIASTSFAQSPSTTTTSEQTTTTDGALVQDSSSTSTTEYQQEKSRTSAGGLFIEPMLSVIREDSSIRSSQLPIIRSDTSGNAEGYGVGLRFGGHLSEIFFIGVDGRYAKMSLSDSFYNDADSDVYNIAPMVGLQTPLFGIRLMAAYVVAGENNPAASSNGINLKFTEPQGLRLGAGVHAGPVAINLEYQKLTYNATEIQSFGSVAANTSTSVDAETEGYALSLGFPIEL